MKITWIILFSILFFLKSFSQEDNLDSLLSSELKNRSEITIATFKATRVINGHSIERMQKGDLDARISHRFGKVNSGFYDFYGLDNSVINLDIDYGVYDWLMLGIGRCSYEKTFSGFAKFSILRQSAGNKNVPVSLSFFSGIYENTLKWQNTEINNHFSSRLSYCHELLLARKFNSRISLQLSPCIIHRNLVMYNKDENDIYSLGFAGRIKITNRIAFNFEYFYVSNNKTNPDLKYTDPLSFGFDIETGGHVFQIIISNTQGLTENIFIPQTTGKWANKDIHIGFNISRVFTLKKKKQPAI
jgi:hypothetical protein